MLWSLEMFVVRDDEGVSLIAPWLAQPVRAKTWEEAYREAMRLRPRS